MSWGAIQFRWSAVLRALERELGTPVKFIGIGEGMDDLIPFEPKAFIDALLEDA